jgi:UDP-N-acetylmuramyl pentapeptide phosphotransferase/UDP-N-acetylglucosamine-1-phosphate transferase
MSLTLALLVAAVVTALAAVVPSLPTTPERGAVGGFSGGAVILGWLAGWSVFALKTGVPFTSQDRWLLGSVLFLWLVGRIDDRLDLRFYWKLLAQAIAAVAIVQAIVPSPMEEWLFSLIAVIWMIGATNAFNLSDGIDGWAPAAAVIAAGAFAFIGSSPVIAIALTGAACGFLPWNVPPAKRFLGDAGSLPIGFLLGVLALSVWRERPLSPSLPFVVTAPLMMPLLDTTIAILRRYWVAARVDHSIRGLLRATGQVVRPDHDHLHHRLERQFGPRGAWLRLVVSALCFAAISVFLAGAGSEAERPVGLSVFGLMFVFTVYRIHRVYRSAPAPQNSGR